MTLGDYVREKRQAQNKTIQFLATESDMSTTTLSEIERNRRAIRTLNINTALKIFENLGMEMQLVVTNGDGEERFEIE